MAVNFNSRIKGRQSRVTSPTPMIPAEKEPCSPAQPMPVGMSPPPNMKPKGMVKPTATFRNFGRADSADGRETGREKADGREGLQEDDGRQPGPGQGSQQHSQHPGGSEKNQPMIF